MPWLVLMLAILAAAALNLLLLTNVVHAVSTMRRTMRMLHAVPRASPTH